MFAQKFLGNEYITEFLKHNLVTILIALLAINSTSMGVVLSKVREIADRLQRNGCFSATKSEMQKSISEQIWLIFISLILFLLSDSRFLQDHAYLPELIDVLIISSLAYAIIILRDTSRSVFIILEFGEEKDPPS